MSLATDSQTISEHMHSWIGDLNSGQQEQLQSAMAQPDERLTGAFDHFLQSLPPGMRDNLLNIIDVGNLTPEQLRGLVSGGDATERMTELAFTARGNTKDSPLDWQARTHSEQMEQGIQISESNLGQMTPATTPDARQITPEIAPVSSPARR